MFIVYIIAALCAFVFVSKLVSNLRNQKLERIPIQNTSELDKAIERYKFLDD